MFLSKIKKTSPILFWCVIVFCFLQLSFTFIKLEATPFFLYGMYSEKFKLSDTISVYKMKLNGDVLNPRSINRWQGDILQTSMENYKAQLDNNKIDIVDTRISRKYPAIYRSGIFRAIKKYILNDSMGLNKFPEWYKQKIHQYTGENVKTFEVFKETYAINFKQKSYQLLSGEKVLDLR